MCLLRAVGGSTVIPQTGSFTATPGSTRLLLIVWFPSAPGIVTSFMMGSAFSDAIPTDSPCSILDSDPRNNGGRHGLLAHSAPQAEPCLYVESSERSPGRKARRMTQLEVRYRYVPPLGEPEMRAVDAVREVYGIRRIAFDEKDRVVHVEFDASRLKEPVVAGLLRRAGIVLQEKLALA